MIDNFTRNVNIDDNFLALLLSSRKEVKQVYYSDGYTDGGYGHHKHTITGYYSLARFVKYWFFDSCLDEFQDQRSYSSSQDPIVFIILEYHNPNFISDNSNKLDDETSDYLESCSESNHDPVISRAESNHDPVISRNYNYLQTRSDDSDSSWLRSAPSTGSVNCQVRSSITGSRVKIKYKYANKSDNTLAKFYFKITDGSFTIASTLYHESVISISQDGLSVRRDSNSDYVQLIDFCKFLNLDHDGVGFALETFDYNDNLLARDNVVPTKKFKGLETDDKIKSTVEITAEISSSLITTIVDYLNGEKSRKRRTCISPRDSIFYREKRSINKFRERYCNDVIKDIHNEGYSTQMLRLVCYIFMIPVIDQDFQTWNCR